MLYLTSKQNYEQLYKAKLLLVLKLNRKWVNYFFDEESIYRNAGRAGLAVGLMSGWLVK